MFNDNFMWLWLHSNQKQNLDKCLYICLFLKYKFIKDQHHEHSCATMNTVVMTRGITPDITATSVDLSTNLLLILSSRLNLFSAHILFNSLVYDMKKQWNFWNKRKQRSPAGHDPPPLGKNLNLFVKNSVELQNTLDLELTRKLSIGPPPPRTTNEWL